MNITNSDNKDFPFQTQQKQKGAASCRACGIQITFKKLETGRSIPLEDDSKVHRCVQWRNWRADDDTR